MCTVRWMLLGYKTFSFFFQVVDQSQTTPKSQCFEIANTSYSCCISEGARRWDSAHCGHLGRQAEGGRTLCFYHHNVRIQGLVLGEEHKQSLGS